MKKVSFILIFLVASKTVFSQKDGDNKITVMLSDTTKLYERTRQAIVNTNFIIREDSKVDTLVTSIERVNNTTIFVMARIIIKGNVVEITGSYGLGYQDMWGFPDWPKGFKRIFYYKESEGWKILRQIAIKLDGRISYSKE